MPGRLRKASDLSGISSVIQDLICSEKEKTGRVPSSIFLEDSQAKTFRIKSGKRKIIPDSTGLREGR